MKWILHKILMLVIPWKCWNWRQTSVLMRVNYWSNEPEFFKLAQQGSDHLTQREMDRAQRGF